LNYQFLSHISNRKDPNRFFDPDIVLSKQRLLSGQYTKENQHQRTLI
jgi:hypothetical protein